MEDTSRRGFRSPRLGASLVDVDSVSIDRPRSSYDRDSYPFIPNWNDRDNRDVVLCSVETDRPNINIGSYLPIIEHSSSRESLQPGNLFQYSLGPIRDALRSINVDANSRCDQSLINQRPTPIIIHTPSSDRIRSNLVRISSVYERITEGNPRKRKLYRSLSRYFNSLVSSYIDASDSFRSYIDEIDRRYNGWDDWFDMEIPPEDVYHSRYCLPVSSFEFDSSLSQAKLAFFQGEMDYSHDGSQTMGSKCSPIRSWSRNMVASSSRVAKDNKSLGKRVVSPCPRRVLPVCVRARSCWVIDPRMVVDQKSTCNFLTCWTFDCRNISQLLRNASVSSRSSSSDDNSHNGTRTKGDG